MDNLFDDVKTKLDNLLKEMQETRKLLAKALELLRESQTEGKMAKAKPHKARDTTGGIDWERQLNFDLEFAKRSLLENGTLTPTFVLHTPTSIIPIACPVPSNEEKAGVYKLVQLMCIAENAQGFAFIAEFWWVEGKRGDDNSLPVSKREDKREAVGVFCFYRDPATGEKRFLSRTVGIERGNDGKPSGFSQINFPEGDNAMQEGAIPNVLPDDPPSEALQQAAKELIGTLRKAGLFQDVEVGRA